MTKQEEIREEIKDRLRDIAHQGEWIDADLRTENLLQYLYSQGAVIKVKCPDCEWGQFGEEVVGMTPCNSCNSMGYIIESLIKGE